VTPLLPDGFEALETWAVEWALPTQNRRRDKRLASTGAELQAFYAAMLPWLERILAHADQFALGSLPERSARLFDLALMHAEIAPNVELYQGEPRVPHSFEEQRFIAVHGDERH
jgi:hypothetical protein